MKQTLLVNLPRRPSSSLKDKCIAYPHIVYMNSFESCDLRSHAAKQTRGYPSRSMGAYHLASGNLSYFAGSNPSVDGNQKGSTKVPICIVLLTWPRKKQKLIILIWWENSSLRTLLELPTLGLGSNSFQRGNSYWRETIMFIFHSKIIIYKDIVLLYLHIS